MTRISNADQVLLLLRSHLERTRKQERKRGTGRSGKPGAAATALQRVERLGALSGLSEHELRRALIAAVLADELGEAVINDAKFQRIVDDVLETIASNEPANAQLKEACKTIYGA